MRHLLLTALVASSTTIVAQLPDYVPPSQLDAWFSLDGDGVDESGNGNQVEAVGANLDTDRFGNPSSCFLLDGDGDYLTFGTSLGNVQDFTAAYWMETTETTGYNLLLNKDCNGCEYTTGDWGFITSNGNSGILSFSLSNSNGGFYEDIGFVADGDWHHVVVTRNATTGAVHFYLDGESVEEHVGPTGLVTNGNALHFGLQQPYNPAYYEGRVDDLGMWSRVLSGEEILGLYQSAPPVFGCTDSSACNFMPEANLDDGSCIDCALFEERCGPGTMWDDSVQLCVVANPSDTDFDGCVSMTDLLDLLTVFGTCNEVPWSCGDPLEYQGYDYETVQIGEQCWFAENLRAVNTVNGDSVAHLQGQEEWVSTDGPGWCYYESSMGTALPEYGMLYNFYVVGSGMCPSGWHIPNFDEWFDEGGLRAWISVEFPSIGIEAGGSLKSTGTSEWLAPNEGATNQFQFNGKPSGGRNLEGVFIPEGTEANFHINNTFGGGEAHHVYLKHHTTSFDRDSPWQGDTPATLHWGASIRCLKDPE